MTEVESQNDYDESGLPGPGAPTPLSSLEVRNRVVEERGMLEWHITDLLYLL